MKPVCFAPRLLKKPFNLLRPAFLQQKRAECPRGYLPNMPETAAKVPLDVFPQLGTVLLRGAGATDDVQGGEHRLSRAGL